MQEIREKFYRFRPVLIFKKKRKGQDFRPNAIAA